MKKLKTILFIFFLIGFVITINAQMDFIEDELSTDNNGDSIFSDTDYDTPMLPAQENDEFFEEYKSGDDIDKTNEVVPIFILSLSPGLANVGLESFNDNMQEDPAYEFYYRKMTSIKTGLDASLSLKFRIISDPILYISLSGTYLLYETSIYKTTVEIYDTDAENTFLGEDFVNEYFRISSFNLSLMFHYGMKSNDNMFFLIGLGLAHYPVKLQHSRDFEIFNDRDKEELYTGSVVRPIFSLELNYMYLKGLIFHAGLKYRILTVKDLRNSKGDLLKNWKDTRSLDMELSGISVFAGISYYY